MAKFGQPQFIIIVKRDDKFMRVNKNNAEWIDNPQDANKYASKYAAKNHLRVLTIPTDRIEYVEVRN